MIDLFLVLWVVELHGVIWGNGLQKTSLYVLG